MALPLTETDKFLLLSAVGAPETRDRISALLDLAGTGNMTGPASATDNALVRFDGTTGALVQNSGVLLNDSNNLSGIAALSASSAILSNTAGPQLTLTDTGTFGTNANPYLEFRDGSSLGGEVGFSAAAENHLYLTNRRATGSMRLMTGSGPSIGVEINSAQLVTIGASGGNQSHQVNGRLFVTTNSGGNGSFGVQQWTDITTNNATKTIGLSMLHYNNSGQSNFGIFAADSTNTANTIYLGTGGTSSQNASTRIEFYTGSTTTSGLGTLRGYFDNSGNTFLGLTAGSRVGLGSASTGSFANTNLTINRQANDGAAGAAGIDVFYDNQNSNAYTTGAHAGVYSLVRRNSGADVTDTTYFSGFQADMRFAAGGGFTITNGTTQGWADYRAASSNLTSGSAAITNYAKFRVDGDSVVTGTNKYGLYLGALTGATNNFGIYSTGNQTFRYDHSTAGQTLSQQLRHSDNTSGTSHAQLYLETGGASGGDPKVNYFVVSGQDWSHGIDNSDSDSWVLSNSANLGTNVYLKATTAGLVTIGASGGTQLHAINGDISMTNAVTGGTRLNITNTDTSGKHWRIVSTGSGDADGAGHLKFYDVTGGGAAALRLTSGTAVFPGAVTITGILTMGAKINANNTSGGIQTRVSIANVSSPPTSAELVATFGTAASNGAGWLGIVDDGNSGAATWLIAVDNNSNYWYTAMTKAV